MDIKVDEDGPQYAVGEYTLCCMLPIMITFTVDDTL